MAKKSLNTRNITDIEQAQPAIKIKDYFLVFSHQFVEENPSLVTKLWPLKDGNKLKNCEMKFLLSKKVSI